MGKSSKKQDYYNQDVKLKFWLAQKDIRSEDHCDKVNNLFNKLKPYELKLNKDVLDFTEEELTDTFLDLALYSCRDRNNNVGYLNSYAEYTGKPKPILPGEADLKRMFAERGTFDVVFSDIELFSAIRVALTKIDYADVHHYDLPIVRLLMLFYGLNEEQMLGMKKSFVNDFKLPTDEIITNNMIRDFIINTISIEGYKTYGNKVGTVRYRKYVESEFLFIRTYSASGILKEKYKSREGLLNQLGVRAQNLIACDDRFKVDNLRKAGKFNKLFQFDIQSGNKDVFLTEHLLKQELLKHKPKVAPSELLEEERYNVYKLHRLIYNI